MAKEPLSINSIQKVLWDEIDKVIKGKTTAANCNAVTNATGKILSSVKLYLEHCKLVGKAPETNLFDSQSKK